MTPDKVVRGREAAQLLDTAAFREAMAEVERHYVEAAVAAKDDAATLENLRHVRALREVREQLKSRVTTGRITAARQEVSNVA